MSFVRHYTPLRDQFLGQGAQQVALARETTESVKKSGAGRGEAGVIWSDDRPNLLQAIDSASGSTPREPDGDPPDLGLRFRCTHRSSTASFAPCRGGAVQVMQWTLQGAHFLLQTRTKVLNNELGL